MGTSELSNNVIGCSVEMTEKYGQRGNARAALGHTGLQLTLLHEASRGDTVRLDESFWAYTD